MVEDKNKKKADEKEDFIPGKESRDDFLSALALAEALIKEDTIKLNVDIEGDVFFEFKQNDIAKIDDAKFDFNISKDEFVILLRTEFSVLATATTFLDNKIAFKMQMPHEVIEQVGFEELTWRQEQLKKIIPDQIKEYAIFRKTLKGNIIEEISWDINAKKYDETRGSLNDIPYVNLQIHYIQPLSKNQPVVKGSHITLRSIEPKHLSIQLHLQDVKDLKNTFEEIEKKLTKK